MSDFIFATEPPAHSSHAMATLPLGAGHASSGKTSAGYSSFFSFFFPQGAFTMQPENEGGVAGAGGAASAAGMAATGGARAAAASPAAFAAAASAAAAAASAAAASPATAAAAAAPASSDEICAGTSSSSIAFQFRSMIALAAATLASAAGAADSTPSAGGEVTTTELGFALVRGPSSTFFACSPQR